MSVTIAEAHCVGPDPRDSVGHSLSRIEARASAENRLQGYAVFSTLVIPLGPQKSK
jgi:hypothetical protein